MMTWTFSSEKQAILRRQRFESWIQDAIEGLRKEALAGQQVSIAADDMFWSNLFATDSEGYYVVPDVASKWAAWSACEGFAFDLLSPLVLAWVNSDPAMYTTATENLLDYIGYKNIPELLGQDEPCAVAVTRTIGLHVGIDKSLINKIKELRTGHVSNHEDVVFQILTERKAFKLEEFAAALGFSERIFDEPQAEGSKQEDCT